MSEGKKVLLYVEIAGEYDEFTYEIMDLDKWEKMKNAIQSSKKNVYDEMLTSEELLNSIVVRSNPKIIEAFELVHNSDSLSSRTNIFDILRSELDL